MWILGHHKREAAAAAAAEAAEITGACVLPAAGLSGPEGNLRRRQDGGMRPEAASDVSERISRFDGEVTVDGLLSCDGSAR